MFIGQKESYTTGRAWTCNTFQLYILSYPSGQQHKVTLIKEYSNIFFVCYIKQALQNAKKKNPLKPFLFICVIHQVILPSVMLRLLSTTLLQSKKISFNKYVLGCFTLNFLSVQFSQIHHCYPSRGLARNLLNIHEFNMYIFCKQWKNTCM